MAHDSPEPQVKTAGCVLKSLSLISIFRFLMYFLRFYISDSMYLCLRSSASDG